MGLTGLKELVVRKPRALEELKGVYAVDAFNTLYQFLATIRGPDGTPLTDSKGRVTSHLSGLFYRTTSMLEKGITPVYVFDGAPSDLKKRTIAERAERKQEAEELLEKARKEGRVEDARMLAQRTARLNKEMVEEAKQMLEMMGLPFVQAPSEGEAQCSFMAREGIVRAAASQDYDALLFGAPLLVRNMTIAGKRKLPHRNIFQEVVPEEISLEETVKALGVTREKMVWMGVLMGTDFNAGVKGIGPKKALKMVKEFNTIEDLVKAGNFEIDFKPVVDLFLNPPSVKVLKEELKRREPDRGELEEFMVEEHDFSRERVENSLARAFNEPKDAGQSQLKKWF